MSPASSSRCGSTARSNSNKREETVNKPREFDAALLEEMRALLGDRVTTSRGVREHHGKDETYFPCAPPDAGVFPQSPEHLRHIVDLCRRPKTPMIPYGLVTSLERHLLATH